eukprot:CAMPEP_0170616084 /NCGR_PEP_ID=MMETSP0224-20130122/25686_1 /TAXON_ID=285029 /ORGANISM="Togula jolla, Strain CCCM 725" /LENGTH=116 /DNA_ID=CAMNT_0010941867 /DNA_START=71 /DNA_END=421 /DNA_ORIENTATION=-
MVLHSRKKKKQNKKTKSSCVFGKGHYPGGSGRFRDQDQVHDDMKMPDLFKPGKLPMDEDLPGMGQFYCIACARFFKDAEVLKGHERSKLHKKKLKKAKEEPHTQRDAEAAIGLSTE